MKEDSGCRKRFRNGGSYGRAYFTGRRAYGARGGQGDPARGRAYDKKGETHVLMGPNGAGKSTLGYVLTGNPKYSVTEEKSFSREMTSRRRRQTSAPRRECSCRFRNRSRCRDSPSRALSAVH